MAVTAEQIADVRSKTNEPDAVNYTDEDITRIIEKYATADELGALPYTWTGTIPTKVVNPAWIETYDLNMAAAEIWENKAAKLAHLFDFSADGGSYTRSQAYQQAVDMARFYKARKKPGTFELIKHPLETPDARSWIGNLPESDM